MKIDTTVGNVGIKLNTDRLDRNFVNAQRELNFAVMKDTDDFVPKKEGFLRRSAWFPEGETGGVLEYNTPYAHLLYVGEKYGPNIPIYDEDGNITGWWSPPKKHPTGEQLEYHEKGTGKEWFERSKEKNLQSWIQTVKNEIGKG